MPSRRLDPDTALEIKLVGNATRLAQELVELGPAVDQLRAIAGGRRDLLAKAAGSKLGGYLGAPATTHPADPYAAALLILAGADPHLIVAHIDGVRRVVETPRYGTR